MEKTTLISGNGRPYEREIPTVQIDSFINDYALENLMRQTGIDFKKNAYGIIEGRPETWEQFAKIFLSYNFLTHDQNNWDGNIMHLQVASSVPMGKRLYYEQNGKRYEGVGGWR